MKIEEIVKGLNSKGYTLDKTYKLEDDVNSLLAGIDADLHFLDTVKVNKTTKIVELNRTQRTVYEFNKGINNFFRVQENVKTGYTMSLTKRSYQKINKTTFLIELDNKKFSLKNLKGFLGII